MSFPEGGCLSTWRKNPPGFTLLEILIAVFIFGVVLSTIFTSYTGTARIVNETEYQADIYSMARVALERMQEDLESLYITPYAGPAGIEEEGEEGNSQASDFVGEDADINGRDADSLQFTSRAHIVFSNEDLAAGTAQIRYYVSEDDEQRHLVLYRSDTPELLETATEEPAGLVLCEKLRSLNLTYYDANGEEYSTWDSTAEAFKHSAPKRVSILLEFENESDPEAPFQFSTAVAIPMGGEELGEDV